MPTYPDMISSSHPRRVDRILARQPRLVEHAMVLFAVVVTWLFFALPQHAHAALYLYFLPVSLSGFYLGRYRSRVMALFCVLVVAIGSATSSEFRQLLQMSDVVAMAVWGVVLGLTSIVTGSLNDERQQHYKQVCESHRQDTLKDALTEIANRRAFDYELKRRLAELDRQESCFSLIFVDIDHFKKLNDTYGHQAGDAVIRGVAQTLDEITREMDLVARYGGEEFAIVFPRSSNSEAKETAERVRRKIEASRFTFQGLKIRITVSVGVAQACRHDTATTLIERADAALYVSKQWGRNRSTYHNNSTCEAIGESTSQVAVDKDSDLVVETSPGDAYWDGETNLPSRRIFVDDLRRRVSEAQRHKTQLSIAVVEVDEFNSLHDNAPEVARKVISVVGELVCTAMRDADLVARYSLGQFAVSMPWTPVEGAQIAAARLQSLIAECQSVKQDGIPLTLSVQVKIASLATNEDAASLLERARSSSSAPSSAMAIPSVLTSDRATTSGDVTETSH